MPSNPLSPVEPAPLQVLVDEREAAVALSVAVNTLRNWRCRGEGPRWRKIGPRCVRYAVADLRAFIEGEGKAA